MVIISVSLITLHFDWQFHPDKQRLDVSEGEAEQHLQRFIDVDQAWKILSNEESRKEYNLQLRGTFPPVYPLMHFQSNPSKY